MTGFNISTTAINVSWSLIPEEYRNGIIIGYRVHYHDNMRHSGSITLPVSQRHVTLDALLSYTLYNISVAGLTKIGEGWNRTFTFVRTNPGGKNLQLYFIYHHSSYSVMYWYLLSSTIVLIFVFGIAPTREPWELVCSGVSSYTVSLHWYQFTPGLTGSILTGYFISYRAVEPPYPGIHNVTLESFKYNYIAENLKAFTNYSFELHVFNPWGRSNTSTVVCQTEEGSMDQSSLLLFYR